MKDIINHNVNGIVIGVLVITLTMLILFMGGVITPYKKKQLLTPNYSGGIILEVNHRGLIMDKLYIIKLNDEIYKVRPYDIDNYYAGDTIK